METDCADAAKLLKTISDKCKAVTAHVGDLCSKAKDGEFSTSKGISFLEVKYQLLLSYLTNLSYVMLKKTHGHAISGDLSIERLVELRTVLEKMRPIDQKLKYQVDKVIRIATTGGAGSSDPMRFKANPEALESKLSDKEEGSGSDSDGQDKKSTKLYRPPKLAAVHYDADETTVDKKAKQVEHLRKRALNSDIMQELKDQYYEGPQEIKETRDVHRLKEDRKAKERQEFEEDNFIRLMLTKKDKQAAKQKRLATDASLGSLTHFDSISGMDLETGNMQDMPSKKRKTDKGGKGGKGGKGSKGKKGKKGFKKKWH